MNGSSQKTVAGLFHQSLFRIPHYQRGYSWEDKQLEDFWSDIDNMPDRGHPFGEISLEQVTDQSDLGSEVWKHDRWLIDQGWRPFYVVDGQQRLTTIVLLMTAIAQTLNDGEQLGVFFKPQIISNYIYVRVDEEDPTDCAYTLGYARDDASFRCFREEILKHQSEGRIRVETAYTLNLKYALGFFTDRIPTDRMKLLDLFKKVTQKLRVDTRIINNDPDVYIRFEVINNRGKALTTLELLKNRLLHLSTLLLEAPERHITGLQERVNSCWSLIYEFLGKGPGRPLNDDDFLRQHWIMYFRDVAKKVGVQKSLLGERFTRSQAKMEKSYFSTLNNYVTSLQESVQDWHFMHHPNSWDGPTEIGVWLERLNRLGYRVCGPLVLAILARHRKLTLAEEDEIEAGIKSISELLSAIERYIFVVYDVAQRRSDAGVKDFYRWAFELYNGASIADLTEKIDKRTDEFFSIDYFSYYLRDMYRGDNTDGWYGWNQIRYFLFEHDSSIVKYKAQGREVPWDKLVKAPSGTITVEHKYPQTPRPNEWPAMEQLQLDEKAHLRGSLGNLLVLSQPKNAALGNDSFARKVMRSSATNPHEKLGYKYGSSAEIEVSEESDWTPQTIKRRGMNLLDFMCKRWRLNISDEEKERLPMIPFVQ